MKYSFIFSIIYVSILFLLVLQSLANTYRLDMRHQNSSDRIAIAAIGDSVSSKISERAGRAPYYLIFEGNGKLIKSIKNPSLLSEGGVSSGVVDLLIKESVQTLIAGKFGAKMTKLLDINKIKLHQEEGIVKVVLNKIINKRME